MAGIFARVLEATLERVCVIVSVCVELGHVTWGR
jgi:hypothetical protein